VWHFVVKRLDAHGVDTDAPVNAGFSNIKALKFSENVFVNIRRVVFPVYEHMFG
jgi:hypothetical protein